MNIAKIRSQYDVKLIQIVRLNLKTSELFSRCHIFSFGMINDNRFCTIMFEREFLGRYSTIIIICIGEMEQLHPQSA